MPSGPPRYHGGVPPRVSGTNRTGMMLALVVVPSAAFSITMRILHQHAGVDRPDWYDKPPARLELGQQRRRNVVRRSGDDDPVVRRVLRPSVIAVADTDGDIGITETRQRLGRPGAELGQDLDGIDLAGEHRQHGGLVAGARADLQHAVARLHLEQVRHQRDDERLGDRLPETDVERAVGVGQVRRRRGNERVAGHLTQRPQHPRIERRIVRAAADNERLALDCLHHALALSRAIDVPGDRGRRHDADADRNDSSAQHASSLFEAIGSYGKGASPSGERSSGSCNVSREG